MQLIEKANNVLIYNEKVLLHNHKRLTAHNIGALALLAGGGGSIPGRIWDRTLDRTNDQTRATPQKGPETLTIVARGVTLAGSWTGIWIGRVAEQELPQKGPGTTDQEVPHPITC